MVLTRGVVRVRASCCSDPISRGVGCRQAVNGGIFAVDAATDRAVPCGWHSRTTPSTTHWSACRSWCRTAWSDASWTADSDADARSCCYVHAIAYTIQRRQVGNPPPVRRQGDVVADPNVNVDRINRRECWVAGVTWRATVVAVGHARSRRRRCQVRSQRVRYVRWRRLARTAAPTPGPCSCLQCCPPAPQCHPCPFPAEYRRRRECCMAVACDAPEKRGPLCSALWNVEPHRLAAAWRLPRPFTCVYHALAACAV